MSIGPGTFPETLEGSVWPGRIGHVLPNWQLQQGSWSGICQKLRQWRMEVINPPKPGFNFVGMASFFCKHPTGYYPLYPTYSSELWNYPPESCCLLQKRRKWKGLFSQDLCMYSRLPINDDCMFLGWESGNIPRFVKKNTIQVSQVWVPHQRPANQRAE